MEKIGNVRSFVKMKRKPIHRKIFHLLLPAVVFFIPVYGRILPPLIFLLFLNWLAEGSYVVTFALLLRDKKRAALFSFSLLYLLYVAGMSWSSNLAYGWFDLEVKLSLLVFPLLFATREPFYLEKAVTRRIFLFFVAGCFASTLILLGHAAIMMAVFHVEKAFYYTQLSWYFHPGYLAMYFTFAIAIAGYGIMEDDSLARRFRVGGVLLVIHLFVVVVLLNSKAGWISLFMVVVIFALGISGLALLLFMLVFPAVRAFRRRELLYLVFLAVFAVNILVESMFENQAGVIYYALFNVILFTTVNQEKLKIKD